MAPIDRTHSLEHLGPQETESSFDFASSVHSLLFVCNWPTGINGDLGGLGKQVLLSHSTPAGVVVFSESLHDVVC